MNGVKHQKWWGWGVEGVAFNHADKPAFATFVRDKIGIDVTKPGTPPPDFSELDVPVTQLPETLHEELVTSIGAPYVVVDDHDRVVHTYGKGLKDLVRVRAGDLPRVPDVVLYPATEEQVRQIVDIAVAVDAVLIPFGGGSNIAGCLTPEAHETRPVLSLDMGRMNQVLKIDGASGLAHIQAGVLGPDMEAQLNAAGWTMGHQPDSFKHSTLGGWVATRSSGMQSDKYGDIADITRGMRSVLPGKVVEVRPLPSTSTGPSIREMLIGSEGRLGVITEVWVQVHRLPSNRQVIAYLFPSWEAGLSAMRTIAASGASPSITRVSDANETAFSLATRKASSGLSSKVGPALFEVLRRRGWNLDEVCLGYVGHEGSATFVRREKSLVRRIVSKAGGIRLGKGPGALYDQKKFDTPYLRDYLLDRGAIGDVSESAVPWSKLDVLYAEATTAAREAFRRLGVNGWVMCHLSHSYHSGACLYFTFAFPPATHTAVLEQYDVVKHAIQQSFIDADGTLSHHHGVGVDHAPWLEDDISEAGTDLTVGLLRSADPGRNLNPGTLLPRHREW